MIRLSDRTHRKLQQLEGNPVSIDKMTSRKSARSTSEASAPAVHDTLLDDGSTICRKRYGHTIDLY